MVKFDNSIFRLTSEDRFEVVDPEKKPTDAELEEVSNALATYVEEVMKESLGFEIVPLLIAPDFTDTEGTGNWQDTTAATTSILASPGWTSAKKILIMIHNASGSHIGIWSRSLCLEQGLNAGTMLPYIEKAVAAGYAVLVLRPNTNSVMMNDDVQELPIPNADVEIEFGSSVKVAFDENGQQNFKIDASVPPRSGSISKANATRKVLIKGSESPESHVISFWENVLPRAINCDHIALLGYGNGASLCHSLYIKSILSQDLNIVHSFVTIEASNIIQEDDSDDIRIELENLAINFEHSSKYPIGVDLVYRKEKLGVSSISVGMPEECKKTMNYNVAISASLSITGVFSYLQLTYDQFRSESLSVIAKTSVPASGEENMEVAALFKKNFSYACSLIGDSRYAYEPPMTQSEINRREEEFKTAAMMDAEVDAEASLGRAEGRGKKRGSIFNFFFKRKDTDDAAARPKSVPAPKKAEWSDHCKSEMSVEDFDLLKVVGKGAFGKVLLVRKKEGSYKGRYYAMKILRKTNVIAGSQVEHTLAERAILLEVKQPYIVHLRFAFQNSEKLYLLTDYYNGGSLFMHLCHAKQFPTERVVFYAAEILSAIDYLHKKNIIYRDLKLENIMMDHNGHLALIDFGLSKHHFDQTGATTFCGTAYYIAPEVLKGYKYGYAVDYWSFGVLIYEMIRGRTPFQDANKKLTFMRILKAKPAYNPDFFSPEAINLVSGLLTLNATTRLGSDPDLGALEVMQTPFFHSMDWGKLSRKEVQPPFVPDLSGPLDTKYVGKIYERMDPTRESQIAPDVLQAAERKAQKQGKALDAVVFPSFSFLGTDSEDSRASSAYGKKPFAKSLGSVPKYS